MTKTKFIIKIDAIFSTVMFVLSLFTCSCHVKNNSNVFQKVLFCHSIAFQVQPWIWQFQVISKDSYNFIMFGINRKASHNMTESFLCSEYTFWHRVLISRHFQTNYEIQCIIYKINPVKERDIFSFYKFALFLCYDNYLHSVGVNGCPKYFLLHCFILQ